MNEREMGLWYHHKLAREDQGNCELLVPNKGYSKHFVDGEPTYKNLAPTLNLGYDSGKKAR